MVCYPVCARQGGQVLNAIGLYKGRPDADANAMWSWPNPFARKGRRVFNMLTVDDFSADKEVNGKAACAGGPFATFSVRCDTTTSPAQLLCWFKMLLAQASGGW